MVFYSLIDLMSVLKDVLVKIDNNDGFLMKMEISGRNRFRLRVFEQTFLRLNLIIFIVSLH